MPVFHLVNCAALTFGPHAVYYYATPLCEYRVVPTMVRGIATYFMTFFAKLICLAAFVSSSDSTAFNPTQEILQAGIGMLDCIGLYYALSRSSGPALSDKIQAVGLGWALADSVLNRLAPLMGAKSPEFSWAYLQAGGHANANLIVSVSFATVVSLIYIRKNKSSALMPFLYLSMLLHAAFPSILSSMRQLLQLDAANVLAADLAMSVAAAVVSWRLYSAAAK
eukprot:CAMPEP_0118924680 /NCGR_PEP_ID=MMETSP1169-20130426/2707_1 /TAXON_ID=36882 /ORGANISM="Pyramimonas obovata, Strain CCMP722" /LENGTH=222 /DNA_ID=CAMNT_0006865811 /DNA_START=74 /DNA_END=740 /DNA_ORIENTATION=+